VVRYLSFFRGPSCYRRANRPPQTFGRSRFPFFFSSGPFLFFFWPPLPALPLRCKVLFFPFCVSPPLLTFPFLVPNVKRVSPFFNPGEANRLSVQSPFTHFLVSFSCPTTPSATPLFLCTPDLAKKLLAFFFLTLPRHLTPFSPPPPRFPTYLITLALHARLTWAPL